MAQATTAIKGRVESKQNDLMADDLIIFTPCPRPRRQAMGLPGEPGVGAINRTDRRDLSTAPAPRMAA